MGRPIHRGAYRTAIGYVLVVMGGVFVIVFPALALLASGDKSYGGYTHGHSGVFAVFGLHLKLFFRLAGSWMIVIWLVAGAFLYICALGLQKLKPRIFSRLIMAGISAFLSCKIVITIAPSGWASLAAVTFTLLWTAVIGAAFGFFVFPRICEDSFQTAPLGRWHWVGISLWVLYFVAGYSHCAYAMHRARSRNDPAINLVFLKWTPGDGEVREVSDGAYDSSFPSLRDDEIEELRAAGLTGTLMAWGNNSLGGIGPQVRVVIIMSRGLRETVDLPKPANRSILYIQTQEGWRAFPPSTPTLPRTIRLSISEPNEHHTFPETMMTTDIGLGHPQPEYGLNTFTWQPEEFQGALPSLPQ